MRISQRTDYLADLFREVEKGKLVPADFQRPYVWLREDVERFWTSLMRGYPVGSFLTWIPPRGDGYAKVGRGRIGPVPAAGEGGVELVIDGQNRLASYAWSMLDVARDPEAAKALPDLSQAERDTWLSGDVLAADPADRSVRFRPRDELGRRLLVPVAVLARSTRLMPYLREWEGANGAIPEPHLDWLGNEAERRIMEARVVVTVLDGLPPAEVLEAYRHIVRAGVPVSNEDFEKAMAYAFRTA